MVSGYGAYRHFVLRVVARNHYVVRTAGAGGAGRCPIAHKRVIGRVNSVICVCQRHKPCPDTARGCLPHLTRHPALSAAVAIPRKVVLLSLPGLRLTLIASCVDDDHCFSGASRRRLKKIGTFDNEAARSLFQWPANREKRVVVRFLSRAGKEAHEQLCSANNEGRNEDCKVRIPHKNAAQLAPSLRFRAAVGLHFSSVGHRGKVVEISPHGQRVVRAGHR